jgi:hypothetical protein
MAILPSVFTSTYPEPAAVGEAGAPMKTLTLGLTDIFLAQLSHMPKFQAKGLLKLVKPQKLLSFDLTVQ